MATQARETQTIGGAPTDANRQGRQLQGGRLEVTLTSRATDKHFTLMLRTRTKNPATGRWGKAEWGHGITFVEYQGRTIATIVPKGPGHLIKWRTDTDALRWAVEFVMRWCAGVVDESDHPAPCKVQSTDCCGFCGQPLTDPISLERGVGPHCFGKHTGSKHAQVSA